MCVCVSMFEIALVSWASFVGFAFWALLACPKVGCAINGCRLEVCSRLTHGRTVPGRRDETTTCRKSDREIDFSRNWLMHGRTCCAKAPLGKIDRCQCADKW